MSMLGSAPMNALLFIPWFRLEPWAIPLPFTLPVLGDTLSIQPFGVLVATGVLLGACWNRFRRLRMCPRKRAMSAGWF